MLYVVKHCMAENRFSSDELIDHCSRSPTINPYLHGPYGLKLVHRQLLHMMGLCCAEPSPVRFPGRGHPNQHVSTGIYYLFRNDFLLAYCGYRRVPVA